jgi:ABC-type transport system involved in cytochrome c biogenesis permease subunit
MGIERITLFCFGASYAVALILELALLARPRPLLRLLSTIFGAAGLLAHTLFLIHALFLAEQRLPLSSPSGSLLFLAWILAIFGVYGSIHHSRQAWAVFVLPLVIGLVVLAAVFDRPSADSGALWDWGLVHGGLLLLAAVGVCVGFVASVMYLVQAHRLKAKALPGHGLRLLSLERLELMNRRAINLAFPLLTAGLLVGLALMAYPNAGWTTLKIVSTVVLWLVYALLLYLRYGVHLRGRHLAVLTIVAFVLLVFTLVLPHDMWAGGEP